MRKGVAVAVVLVVGAVAAFAVIGGSSEQVPKAEAGALPPVDEVVERVERLRGLEFERVPKVEEISLDKLEGELKSVGEQKVTRSVQEQAAAAEIVLTLAGFLKPEEVDQLEQGGGGGELLGIYVPERRRVYVIKEAVEQDAKLAEATLAHELTHALEDQAFSSFQRKQRPFAESTGARLGLIEGSASLLELRYAKRHLGADGSVARLIERRRADVGQGGGPAALRLLGAFPYVDGARFARHVYEAGGWRAVNRAHRRPPCATEAILHPDRWKGRDRHERPRFRIQPVLGRGWERVGRGDLGEVETAALLVAAVGDRAARAGAAGWDAGAFEAWFRGDPQNARCEPPCRQDAAAVLAWRWDTLGDAREFVRHAQAHLRRALKAAPNGDNGWRLRDGAATLRTFNRRTVLALAPTADQADRLVKAASDG
jgi:hypothetical protein